MEPTATPVPAPGAPEVPDAAPVATTAPDAAVATAPADERAWVHREPVVTTAGTVLGYVVTVTADGVPPEARALVEHARYMELDLAAIVADRIAFIPATVPMLDGIFPEPVVPGRLVLDLPTRFEQLPDATDRATALRALGARLALVGYRATPTQDGLLRYVDFVVVDVREVGVEALPGLVERARQAGPQVLVTGATDPATFERCVAAGVDGMRAVYGERRPTGGQTRVLRAGELQCLAVLHLLSQPDVQLSEVAQVVDTDPVLTLRVLHLVNSGAFGITSVDTVLQAVVLLGARELTALVSALLVDARPDAMDSLWFILARALTCEALSDDGAGYTVGMLSALASELGLPPEVVVEKVGVSAMVADAVVDGSGPLGQVLTAVRAHENKDPDAVVAAGLDPAEVSDTYLRCVADALATAQTATRTA